MSYKSISSTQNTNLDQQRDVEITMRLTVADFKVVVDMIKEYRKSPEYDEHDKYLNGLIELFEKMETEFSDYRRSVSTDL